MQQPRSARPEKPDFPWWLAAAIAAAIAIGAVIAANEIYSQVFSTVAAGVATTIFVTLVGFSLASLLGLAFALMALSD
jgi:polar amino acid transport system permease protein